MVTPHLSPDEFATRRGFFILTIFIIMILTSTLLNDFMNSKYIKKAYPMIDNIKTKVVWDGDEEFPFYKIYLSFKLNDPSINSKNMRNKMFDPHYLVDTTMMELLNNIKITSRDISQIYIKVYDTNGELIYG